MEVSEAFSLISHAIDADRAAAGYLVSGDISGNCMELAFKILHKLFPDSSGQIDALSHPDVVVLEPEGKARIITVDSMRERIVGPMSETAFSGGWKVGIVKGADRLNDASANAFLKSLEEPTPKTLYLLLTDRPEGILPTIASRTQRVDLRLPSGILEGEDFEEVAEAFAAKDARALAAKLDAIKSDSEDADVALARKSFFLTLLGFTREMMIGGKLPLYRAFRNIEAVEEAYRRSEKSMNDESVLSYMLERITFPSGGGAAGRSRP